MYIEPSHPSGRFPSGIGGRLQSSHPSAGFATTDELTFSDIWKLFHRNRLILLLAVLVGLTVGLLYSIFTTTEYEATASVQYAPETSAGLGLTTIAASELGDNQNAIDTEIKILQSPAITLQVMRDLHMYDFSAVNDSSELPPALTERSLSRFASHLAVQQVPKTNLIEIRFRDHDPTRAALVANAVVKTYVQRNFQTRYQAAHDIAEWLDKQLSGIKVGAEDSQRKLADFQRQAGMLGTDEADNTVTDRLRQINDELTAAEADRIIKEARYRMMSSQSPDVISVAAMSPTLQTLRTQQAQLQVDYAQLTTKFGPGYPEVAQLHTQISQVDASIATEMTRVAKRVENEYRAALQTESMLRDQFDQQKVEAYKLNDTAAQYSIMRGEVDASRELYNDVQIKLKEAGITAGLSSTNVTILDVARTPVKPVVPNVKVALLTGLSVGLVLGIIVAFFRESLNDTINSVEQLEEASSLPVIALVPNRLEDKGSSTTIVGGSSLMSPVILGMPQSKSAEAYRGLRTCILLYSVDQPPNVIAITSSIPQEGKTTTSVNMAIALAQRGAKVLLVDADLRRPSVHKYFAGSRPKRGLTSLLSGDASMEDVCLPADEATPGLTVIPSGPLTPYPSEMLSSSRFRDSLNTWRQSFDHIVIDTPPITAVTDPVIIAQYADAVVLVARAGFVTKPALSRSINLLIRAQIKIAGIVLNRVDIATEYYYYGSGYYGYGRKKGSADAYYAT